MRTSLFMLIAFAMLFSCKKEENAAETMYLPKMKVKEFNAEVSIAKPFLSLDMDDNAFGDVSYQVYTFKDMNLPGYRYKFYGGGSSFVSFPLNTNSTQQETKRLKKGDVIDANSFAHPYAWAKDPFVLMGTKNVPYFDEPTSWEGSWINVSHVYQGFFVEYPYGRFYGWVELSFDTSTEKLIIHSAAIATEPFKGVKAGYK